MMLFVLALCGLVALVGFAFFLLWVSRVNQGVLRAAEEVSAVNRALVSEVANLQRGQIQIVQTMQTALEMNSSLTKPEEGENG